jgi:hypothetical protein
LFGIQVRCFLKLTLQRADRQIAVARKRRKGVEGLQVRVLRSSK